jgi:hypothetical protein
MKKLGATLAILGTASTMTSTYEAGRAHEAYDLQSKPVVRAEAHHDYKDAYGLAAGLIIIGVGSLAMCGAMEYRVQRLDARSEHQPTSAK